VNDHAETDRRRAFSTLLFGVLFLLAGCSDSSPPRGPGGQATPDGGDVWGEELFQYAVDNLDRLEEFNSAEMLQQIVERLDQWVRSQPAPADWQIDPLVATLPEPFPKLPQVATLNNREFFNYDAVFLQEAVWLRDVSKWARGEKLDDLERAKSLFDWTVRNIQLEKDASGQFGKSLAGLRLMPWETLLLGRGTAMERAWVFILLARQQEIDAAMLAVADPDDPKKKRFRNWVVAVLVEGKLYLFDPALGLPIPAPDGVKFHPTGRLEIQPATLSQVVADKELLRQLDLDPLRRYPVTSSQLVKTVAMLEASPSYLSARMKLLESRMAGKQKMVLTANPTEQARRLKACPKLADVRIWLWPYEAKFQRVQLSPEAVGQLGAALLPFQLGNTPALWKARVLHLKGRFVGEQGATRYYQMARPSNTEMAEAKVQLARMSVQKAIEKAVEEASTKGADWATIQAAKQKAAKDAENTVAERMEPVFEALRRAKQDASYWLGLVAFHRENYRSAIDYFSKRTLEASPNGPWTHGAKYNLARTYEKTGQPEKAIELYESDTTSPAHYGNLLRARWLKPKKPETPKPKKAKPQQPEPSKPEKAKPQKPESPEPEKAKPQQSTDDASEVNDGAAGQAPKQEKKVTVHGSQNVGYSAGSR